MKIFNRINPADRGPRGRGARRCLLFVLLARAATRSTSSRTSRAPSRSTRARTSRSSAWPSARSTAVVPEGTKVRVKLPYDAKYKVPADAKAAVISPSIVGDRFVQLTPAYDGGNVMADKRPPGRRPTATPLELDEIFRSLNDLNIALGPDGANKSDAGGVGPADPAARLHRAQLRWPGRAVQQDPEELRRLHQDARRQQGRAVRHAVPGREVHQHAGQERQDRARASTTPSPVAPTCWPASARTSPPCCAT